MIDFMSYKQQNSYHLGWGEQLFVVVYLTLFAIVPFFNPDIYPFTAMPMYSDSQREYYYFTVTDAAGSRQSVALLGLGNFDIVNPAPRIGVKPPKTIFERWSLFLGANERQQAFLIQEQLREMANTDPLSAALQQKISYPLTVQLMHIFVSQELGDVRHERVSEWQIEPVN